MHRVTTKTRARNNGFSLLELVVVVAVIALISSMVIPMFGESLRSMRRQRYIDDFMTAMKYAQERAITDSVEHRIYIDEKANAFWVCRQELDVRALTARASDTATLPQATFVPVEDAPGRKTFLPETLSFGAIKARKDKELGGAFIAFYPTGATDIATVTIERGKRSSLTIATEGRLAAFKITEKGTDT